MAKRIILKGVGEIGKSLAREICKEKEYEILKVIDATHAGKTLGELLGNDDRTRIVKEAELTEEYKGDLLVLLTTSRWDDVKQDFKEAASKGIHVLSSSEGAFYPYYSYSKEAKEMDKLAKENNSSLVSRAMNPGWAMDVYPLHLVNNMKFDHVKSITVKRHDDTLERRRPLLAKTGAGLTAGEFQARNDKGSMGHVGLVLSAAYLAYHLGFRDFNVDFSREPIFADEELYPRNFETIPRGRISGLHETAFVEHHGKTISLDLIMAVGATNINSVRIIGEHRGEERHYCTHHDNFVNGDIATVRLLKDLIPHMFDGEGLNKLAYVPDPQLLMKGVND